MDSRIYSSKMIDSLKNHLEKCASKYITYPKFIFLCGKSFKDGEYCNSNRGIIEEYIRKQSNNVFIVLSEKLWETNFDKDIDLLTFEEFLAEVSDDIILFAESEGTFCELGAFAYAENLFGSKLTIVNDLKYEHSDSFINKGPTKKAKEGGATVIYASLGGTGLLASDALRLHIKQKADEFKSKTAALNRKSINTDENKLLIYPFIIEILELIKLLQPIDKLDLISIYKQIKGFNYFTFVKSDKSAFHRRIELDYIYKLLSSVGLIQLDGNTIKTDKHQSTQSLMFKYSGYSEDKERNLMICRKYRYGGKVY